MRIDIVTLFPKMLEDALSHSMIGRAQQNGLVQVVMTDPRTFTHDNHRSVDDRSYGGGPGMVMMAPPIEAALDSLELGREPTPVPVVLTDAAGVPFRQKHARELASVQRFVLVCGHYEGTDERVRTKLCTHAFSIGDFVLTGGELPSLMIVDAVVRLLPGVLGDPLSHEDDSYEEGLLGHPLYTRPVEFQGEPVPEVLLKGNHKEIAKWKRAQSLQRTRETRPDLFVGAQLTAEDVDLLK